MKLRIGGLMLAFGLLVLSVTAFGGGLRNVLAREISRPVAAVAPVLPYPPQVVARVTLKGQTRQIPQTPFFTVPSDGLFRISAYLLPTATGTTGDLGAVFFYQDEAGPENQEFIESADHPGCGIVNVNCSMTVAIRAVAGSSISYLVAFDTSDQLTTYDVSIVLERLQ